ncbi:MAG: stalk domain-containing protein [Oscillospiraceae bacterium]|nr:stalk domain-containing protein [Oscillospiraceae bacterium]
MRKHKLTKRFICAVLAAICMLSLTSPLALASTETRVFIEGSLIIPRDVQGRVVNPIIVDGTTFLPIRAVGEAFGREIEWDGARQAVIVGTPPASIPARGANIRVFIDGRQLTARDAQGRVVHPIIREGTTFLPLRAIGEAFGREVHWDARNRSVFVGRGTLTIRAGSNEHIVTMADILALEPRAVTQRHRDEIRNFTGVPLAAVFARAGVNTADMRTVTFSSEDGFSAVITISEALDRNNSFIVITQNGNPLGTIETGGRGPFMNVVSLDMFANRSARYLNEIVLS